MFKKLTKATAKPAVWSAYTAEVMWADSHIARQMLDFHLNPDINVASRTAVFINESVDWLTSELHLNEASKTIDFGCGPGLYTQRLKAKGIGTVVGLDFSENSLNYAAEQATRLNLAIEYHPGNYLNYTDSRQFDLITLIMCDLCALSPSQRSLLLGKFKSMLSPNGVIALDVYTATRFAKQSESVSLTKNAMNGFWSAEDYWCIQSSFKYEDNSVTLDKYVISEAGREWIVYNWLQHFTIEILSRELEAHDLEIRTTYSDLRGTPYADGDEMAVVIRHK
ncbi:class I SAM-dependent methyltransferase [Vibrio mangrovi]|uniref:Bifunctional 3-demethylubiquinone-9 3-methyltransferase/ 2-octaprenyl-6-hydroxy phenol methylase n=1 Tax=Vibrio mangrovi TaxID=474394 RepID=A0A1Y6IWT3_9VIBR|nr:class I SAM-dependent methyltransferase [Vibrio mangrovi]MDW6005445.1 class I SAM-dependent methyltransferase [Vibrio mangrovi]SMS02114.1 bifunctional 3-demethylubiquinone-9 3-methyltransferase/ 2-octaprenyl-6-hydroxy phenol methylase [Vibrio mangrovi]